MRIFAQPATRSMSFGALLAGVCAATACAAQAPPAPTPVPTANTPVLPATTYNYSELSLPAHFLGGGGRGRGPGRGGPPGRGGRGGRGGGPSVIGSDNTPRNNVTTDAGATLGRVLFYDVRLSANGTVACASCHQQKFGFSDTATLSAGFQGGTTRRHAMSLANARYYAPGRFFWDERAGTLEEQVLMPLQDPVEMGMTLTTLVQAVERQPYYPDLFTAAFGSSDVTSDRIARALAQFVRSIVSSSSRYDSNRAAVNNPRMDFPGFTAEENLGKRLFFNPGPGRAPCSGCHSGEAFIADAPGRGGGRGGSGATNNGLESLGAPDRGVAESSGNRRDEGRFKTPSLRNVAVTAPYMHDGRFTSLEEVLEHYSTGIRSVPNLDRSLQGRGNGARLYRFSDAEKAAIIAFLRTLTDQALLTDPRFSDPFAARR